MCCENRLLQCLSGKRPQEPLARLAPLSPPRGTQGAEVRLRRGFPPGWHVTLKRPLVQQLLCCGEFPDEEGDFRSRCPLLEKASGIGFHSHLLWERGPQAP